ncbi:MAG: hypothetical protein KIT25_20435 [Enhydrobacter sp.]|nr:MAG: hypothetical protein KIT25_20435 [Enhydrobacter sp.]
MNGAPPGKSRITITISSATIMAPPLYGLAHRDKGTLAAKVHVDHLLSEELARRGADRHALGTYRQRWTVEESVTLGFALASPGADRLHIPFGTHRDHEKGIDWPRRHLSGWRWLMIFDTGGQRYSGSKQYNLGVHDVAPFGWGNSACCDFFVQYIEVSYIEQATTLPAWTCGRYSLAI